MKRRPAQPAVLLCGPAQCVRGARKRFDLRPVSGLDQCVRHHPGAADADDVVALREVFSGVLRRNAVSGRSAGH